MIRIIFAAALLSSCSGTSFVQSTPDRRSCEALPGWDDVAKASADKFLIFGETHGTQEGPLAVHEFVCQVATNPVLVAVELDSALNEQLQQAWEGYGQARSSFVETLREAFLRRLDGVGSQAMLDMMVRLFDLKQAGAEIDIVAFNGARDPEQAARFAHLTGQEPHEAAQAENIRDAAAKRSYSHVVVLVGSLHAQKTPVEIGDTQFEPMAMKLAPSEQVISLRMVHSGGAAWNCRLKSLAPPGGRSIMQSDLECAAHPVGGSKGSERGMTLAMTEDKAFDGQYDVGNVSASPPPT